MGPARIIQFRLPKAEMEGQIARALATWMGIRKETEEVRRLTHYDTFDWRIHRGGGTYETWPARRGGLVHLWRGDDGHPRHQLTLRARPGFALDLPEGAFRDAALKVLEMRTLLPVVTVVRRRRILRALDPQEKTVARLAFEEVSAGPPELAPTANLPRVVRVHPIRGYEAEARRIALMLEREFRLPREGQGGFTAAARAIGIEPGDYDGKLRIDLEPRERADNAVRRILLALLTTMERNEDGLRRAVDTEFLHDFRVAVRRTRSALTQIRDVLPAEDVERFRSAFARVGTETGPLRDLDVYLLKMDGYRSYLPEAVHVHLDPLESFLREERRATRQKLIQFLDSDTFGDLMRAWRRFLAEPPAVAPEPPNAVRPVREVASEQIWRVYRRVLRKGRAIGPTSEAARLHDLRIRCKKLRYLLEFFRSLYEEEVVPVLIRELKRLQDNLGDFNDYEVQQESLSGFAQTMAARNQASMETSMTMGRLIERLAVGQAKERRRFGNRFAGFASPRNGAAFRRLFAPAEPAVETTIAPGEPGAEA